MVIRSIWIAAVIRCGSTQRVRLERRRGPCCRTRVVAGNERHTSGRVRRVIGQRVEFKEPGFSTGWAAAAEVKSIETITIAERRNLFDTLLQNGGVGRAGAASGGSARTGPERPSLVKCCSYSGGQQPGERDTYILGGSAYESGEYRDAKLMGVPIRLEGSVLTKRDRALSILD